MTARDRLREIYAAKVERGLVSVSFCMTGAASDASGEEVAAELVGIHDAIAAGHAAPFDFGDLSLRKAP